MSSFLSILRKNKTYIVLFLIIVTGFYFRTFNIYWDNGFSFHPDERAIAIKVADLEVPKSMNEFTSQESSLNPKFFAYGSFPLYLLKIVSSTVGIFYPELSVYPGIFVVGRVISAIFDTLTIFIIFLIGRKLFGETIGLLSSFIYSLSVLPIQLSHFFAVDTILTTFLCLTLLFILKIYEKESLLKSLALGLFFGLAMATKVSALAIGPIVVLVYFIRLFEKEKKKIHYQKLIISFLVFILTSTFIFIVTQPYALIDWTRYLDQTTFQSKMSSDPFIFPYTLQFVGKIKYVYELQQIFFWGLGPVTTTFSLCGLLTLIIKTSRNRKKRLTLLLFLSYGLFYFTVFGSFAVGWIRYMLPIYPFLAITAGWFLANLMQGTSIKRKFILSILIIIISFYPISFINIYTKPNTRVQASTWIQKYIPHGSVIANEHWDDSLPVFDGQNYSYVTLPLYEPDVPAKWSQIENSLDSADYLIIASNRLYTPLQKLTDCKNLPTGRCYIETARYYSDLFSEKLGFRKVAEFSSYPTFPLVNIELPDDQAAEDFTVFDHPKIFIFKKIDLHGLTY